MDLIAGLDEVGAGALAGPLVVVATAFRGEMPSSLRGLTDSKAMTKVKRKEMVPAILDCAALVGLGWATPKQIDLYGMARAWQIAASMALEGLEADVLLVDGVRAVEGYKGRQQTVVKGDLKHWQISAASVVAKVSRDYEMAYLAEFYEGYKWEVNSGYGSPAHRSAISDVGACPLHRQSFLKKILKSPESPA
jgi:ribonuclease HII